MLRRSCWAVLALLAAGAAISAAVDSIIITHLEWTEESDTSVTLSACAAAVDFTDHNVTLLVGDKEAGSRNYYATTVGDSCANFSDSVPSPSPDQALAFELFVVDALSGELLQRGYVNFTLGMTTITVRCATNFVRSSITSGSFGDGCISGLDEPSVCYTAAQTPRVCVLGLDDANSPELQVCVTQTPAVDTGTPGALDVSSLNYPDGSVSIYTDASDLDLIVSNQRTETSTVSSCQDACIIEEFAPSSDVYDLCGVFTDTGGAMTSAKATFQDLNLMIYSKDPVLDFYLVNKNSAGTYSYKVYTGEDAATVLTSGASVGLDCSRVPPDAYCYGFVTADAQRKFLAVAYDDGTNAVVAPTLLGNY